MKAILIKYHACTHTKPSRFSATTEAGRKYYSFDYEHQPYEQARIIAQDYCAAMGWPKPKGIGQLPSGDYVATLEEI